MVSFAAAGIDAMGLIALGFDTIEIRSRVMPPMVIPLAKGTPNPDMDALLQKVQPAVFISGRLGRFQIAPYGTPSGIDPLFSEIGDQLKISAGVFALALVALGYFLGSK